MGLLSITVVLSAPDPVVTVALAAVILHERMWPVQVALRSVGDRRRWADRAG